MKVYELVEMLVDCRDFEVNDLNIVIDEEKEKVKITGKKKKSSPKIDKATIVREKLKSENSKYTASEFREAFKYYHLRALGTPYISNAPMDYKYLKQIFKKSEYDNDDILILRKYFKMATHVYTKDQKTIVHLGWKMPEVLRALDVEQRESQLDKLSKEEFTGEVF